jgi:carbonic anhydrase
MLTFKNEDIQAILKERLGADASHIDFLPFPDLKQSVLDDVAIVKNSEFINPGTPINGFIYHVESGKLEHVISDETAARVG